MVSVPMRRGKIPPRQEDSVFDWRDPLGSPQADFEGIPRIPRKKKKKDYQKRKLLFESKK